MPELPSIASKVFPALTKALLKFSFTILFAAPSGEWLIRLLTTLGLQFARHITILPLMNLPSALHHSLWLILAATQV
jgi:hypothetical protein